MATITQDMRYRLSLIKYAERFGVTKAAIKYKPTVNTFIVGNDVMTVLLGPFVTALADPIIIQTNIPLKRSS